MDLLGIFRRKKSWTQNPNFFSPFINDFSGDAKQYSCFMTMMKGNNEPVGFEAMFNRDGTKVATHFILEEGNKCHIDIDVEGNGRRWFYCIEGNVKELLQQKRDEEDNLVPVDEEVSKN